IKPYNQHEFAKLKQLTPLPKEPFMPTAQEIEFAKLVIERGFATPDQIRECFSILAQMAPGHHIGTVLIERGYLNQQNAQQLFQIQQLPTQKPHQQIQYSQHTPQT